MNDNSKCFIRKDEKTFEEITYKELIQRTNNSDTYRNKKFIYLHGMLLEVSLEEYKKYHKERERNRYAKKVIEKLNVVSIDKINEDDDFDDKEVIVDCDANIEQEVIHRDEIKQLSKALLMLTGVRIDIWTHFMRGCIIDYVH